MKKILNTIVIAGILLLMSTTYSCSKFLDIKPQSSLTTGNAYNSAQDLENALAGAYRAFYYEYYQWLNVLLGDMRADNSYIGGSGDPPLAEYDNVAITVANSSNYNNWSQIYTGIGRCNVILDKINTVTDPALDVNNLRGQIIGQASFLRAFHYFQLVKLYGGVPIELNSNSADPAKTNLPRSSETEVYNQIVKDLEVALANCPDLAPPILARVDKVTDSEILGPVMRPLPMALLGIAGNVAFLRSPSGQTGLVKEGDELSGLKLLRIGTNRVLIEQDGQQKELTIFAGYGGESLLPQQKENVP